MVVEHCRFDVADVQIARRLGREARADDAAADVDLAVTALRARLGRHVLLLGDGRDKGTRRIALRKRWQRRQVRRPALRWRAGE